MAEYVDREHLRAATKAGCVPAMAEEHTPHAIPIKHKVFEAMKDAAVVNGMTPAEQINIALRQWLGWDR